MFERRIKVFIINGSDETANTIVISQIQAMLLNGCELKFMMINGASYISQSKSHQEALKKHQKLSNALDYYIK